MVYEVKVRIKIRSPIIFLGVYFPHYTYSSISLLHLSFLSSPPLPPFLSVFKL